MISCITYRTAHLYGIGFSSQFELRKRCFVERQNYSVPQWDDMEYDQYDSPACAYLVYQDKKSGRALGVSRLSPINAGCMIRDLWPGMVSDHDIFQEFGVWEGTRFCIDQQLPPDERLQICRELVLAYQEQGLITGVKKIIGIMPSIILRSVFKKNGCDYRLLGPKAVIDGMTVQAAVMDINHCQLENMRAATGVFSAVIRTMDEKNGNVQKAA